MSGDDMPEHLFWLAEDNFLKMWVYIAKSLGITKHQALQHSPADFLALVIDNNLEVARENHKNPPVNDN